MGRPDPRLTQDRRLAFAFVTPAVSVIALIAIFPLVWTVWNSLHLQDLRMPWLGHPFIGLDNYVELARDPRFWSSLGHTLFFTAATVSLELVLGLVIALAMNSAFHGRGAARATSLLPWAIPTVVAALLWRFMFDSQAGIVNALLVAIGFLERPMVWFIEATTAWIPVILSDVWKTTPFVAILLLAGLQGIDRSLYEAAEVDGAGAWWRLWHITIPLLKPTIFVALIFRTLDAFRVFDLLYALTGGGPGTATEPIALYTHTIILQHLRFGYGSALSVVVFIITFVLALIYIRGLGLRLSGDER